MKIEWLSIRFLTFLVAFCSLTYELLLAHSLSVFMGNTVLRYSLTIGVYLASLGLGAYLYKESKTSEIAQLIRIEFALSIVGGFTVISLASITAIHQYLSLNSGAAAQSALHIAYLLASHLLIVVIGVLSGFEIPALMTLSRSLNAGSANIVLAFDYAGSLVGAILFPLILLPVLGLYASANLVALLNLGACFILLFLQDAGERRKRVALALVGLSMLFISLFMSADQCQAFFLKKHYHARHYESLGDLFSLDSNYGKIESHQSHYQRIDLVYFYEQSLPQNFQNEILERLSNRAPRSSNYKLYLNSQIQHSSNTEQFYHEFFAHIPVQWSRLPERVLILGGGDGLLAREMLKYKGVKNIVQIELDPEMIRLATTQAPFTSLNRHSLEDPRVHLIVADAYQWLKNSKDKFDAIYLDFPFPVSHDLSLLYSVEFYQLAKGVLAPSGYLAADIPKNEELTEILSSTARQAGFERALVFESKVDPSLTDFSDLEERFLKDRKLQLQFVQSIVKEQQTDSEDSHRLLMRSVFYELVEKVVTGNLEERFMFCQVGKPTLNTRFKDYNIELDALNILRFRDVTKTRRVGPWNKALVNSVFRPSIPRPFYLPKKAK